LSRCYIAGFLPECVMLCRAVVENAFVQKFADKELPLPATESGETPMRVRIEAARRFKFLSPARANDAWIVWKRGSKAAHEDPGATTDVLDTIRMTMGVLSELYGG